MNVDLSHRRGRRPLLLALTAAAVGAWVGSADARLRPPAPSLVSAARAAEDEPSAAGDLRPAERTFVREVSALSHLEMSLAELGVSQAASSELRSFAQQLASDCRQISDSIETLARKKNVVILPATGASKDSYNRLAEKSGSEFDRAFVHAMTPANDEMVKYFEEALSGNTKDSDVRELAGNYLPILRDHANRVHDLKRTIE